MRASILLRGGRVVDPSQKLDAKRDVLITDGQVEVVTDGGEVRVRTFTGRAFRIEEGRK